MKSHSAVVEHSHSQQQFAEMNYEKLQPRSLLGSRIYKRDPVLVARTENNIVEVRSCYYQVAAYEDTSPIAAT